MSNCEPHIRWMWDGFGPCDKPRCLFFLVEAGPPPIFRGTTSPHGCVENAVRAAREGNRSRAIRWLQAGQSHNGDAQRCFAQNQDEVLEYIVRVYGPAVPNILDERTFLPSEESEDLLHIAQVMNINIKAMEDAQMLRLNGETRAELENASPVLLEAAALATEESRPGVRIPLADDTTIWPMFNSQIHQRVIALLPENGHYQEWTGVGENNTTAQAWRVRGFREVIITIQHEQDGRWIDSAVSVRGPRPMPSPDVRFIISSEDDPHGASPDWNDSLVFVSPVFGPHP